MRIYALLAFIGLLYCVSPAEAHAQDETLEATSVSMGDASRFSFVGSLEANLVGLAVGVRPELLWRPFDPEGGGNVRFSFGILGGPELWHFPIALGWRQVFLSGPFRIQLGAGVEQQTFVIPDFDTLSRTAFYAETGFEILLDDNLLLLVQYQLDFSVITLPGFGMGLRAGLRWDLDELW